ncbi:MAG: hypothetical protein Unbinned3992contig1000_19 [Prokaryotic dsDNA virus sp.]|nr:MAG: hypothetical protein Unbinned3992contig1000_19 [Prokaryotic dsDNA virus sp.]|tara:strand:+ start:5791 stop:6078 length:288 start_codon:yes stop_codon:yes gene_type:complete
MSRLEDAYRRATEAEVDHAVRNLNLPKVICVEHEPTLEECQQAVGGLIEAVYLDDGRLMYVNENGLIVGLPVNEMASQIAGRHIVGDVVIIRDWK